MYQAINIPISNIVIPISQSIDKSLSQFDIEYNIKKTYGYELNKILISNDKCSKIFGELGEIHKKFNSTFCGNKRYKSLLKKKIIITYEEKC